MQTTINVLTSIKDKGMKVSWVIDKMHDMNRKKFYQKCKDKNWTANEIADLKSLNVL